MNRIRFATTLTLCCALFALPDGVHAHQDDTGKVHVQNLFGTSNSTVATSPTDVDDQAWEIYHRGTMYLAVGDVEQAKKTFQELIDAQPTGLLTAKALEIIEIIDGPAGLSTVLSKHIKPATPPMPPTPPSVGATIVAESGSETTTGLARGELVTGQTAHGVILGVQFCVLVTCSDERAIISSILVGAGLGLAGSLLYAPGGIQPGHSAAINSGSLWGAWFGLSSSAAFDLVDDSRTLTGTMMATQVLGLVGGGLLYKYFEPTGGDVSLVNSAGTWSGIMTSLFLSTFNVNGQTEFWLPMFLTTHAAGVGAAVLTRHYSMSRGRVLIIDGSAVLGGLVGVSAVILTAGNNAESEAIQVSMMLGIVGGLALGTYFTREFDGPDLGASLAVIPTEGGALLTVGAEF